MIVGIGWFDLHIRGVRSLKEKRRVVKSIKEHIRSNYNVSVAEVGSLDKWQRAEIGVAHVGNDRRRIDSILSKIAERILNTPDVGVIDYHIDID